jgi:DNA-binding Xre family transcriptional regulator
VKTVPVVITLKTYLAHLQDTQNIKLSIRQLAEESGLKQSALQKIADNQVDGISRKKLAAIIAALREYDEGCDVGDLIRFVP